MAVERDPHARGVAIARELDVPLVLEDAGAPGVLDRARIRHSKSLLVLTRDDSENLDIVMAARETTPSVRVVMRLYDDDFAATVQRTLRASYPQAPTRSRSVSALAAPSFAAAMMGRHVLGVMPVERGSLLFTVVDVAGHPELEGRSIHQAFREHEWRVLAVGSAVARPTPYSTDTLTGIRSRRPGFDWRPVARAGAACGRPRRAGDDTAWPGHPHDRGAAASDGQAGMRSAAFAPPVSRPPEGRGRLDRQQKAEHCESATPVPTSPCVVPYRLSP
ncbi:NAD-binding protein [Streptomyces sp. NPDC056661]|uniref:NAD-binding protein n=1 Tax=Streptomyces sp. NPDC056661 TaxID=3345898 RepID=UPI0036C33E53